MIQLSTPIQLPPSPPRLGYGMGGLSMGSCFSEHIGAYLRDGGLSLEINPFGIQYNPLSIAEGLNQLLKGKDFEREDLFEYGGLYHSFLHHGSFSAVAPEEALLRMNEARRSALELLPHLRFLLLTWGTAYVYRLATEEYGGGIGSVVSNCHKLPERTFSRERTSLSELPSVWCPLIEELRERFPDLIIVQAVSPVRHLRDGAHGNALSKATLLLFAEELTRLYPQHCFYFPSYELVLDELRDYRYYADDLVHPSTLTQRIVQERFASWLLDEEAERGLPQAHRLRRELCHRPLHEGGKAHTQRLETLRERIQAFRTQYPLAQLYDLPSWID